MQYIVLDKMEVITYSIDNQLTNLILQTESY